MTSNSSQDRKRRSEARLQKEGVPFIAHLPVVEDEETEQIRSLEEISLMSHKSRIMYVEYKGGDIVGPARIGRVTYSKAGKSVYYRGRTFASLNGYGFKANFVDVETREEYWISGCKKNGTDALYSTIVEIDEDVREEYWVGVRNEPKLKERTSFKCIGKYSK